MAHRAAPARGAGLRGGGARRFSPAFRHRASKPCAAAAAGGPAAPSAPAAGEADLRHIRRAAEVSMLSAGQCAPHPRSGCVLADASGRAVVEAYQLSSGGRRAEEDAARAAREIRNLLESHEKPTSKVASHQ